MKFNHPRPRRLADPAIPAAIAATHAPGKTPAPPSAHPLANATPGICSKFYSWIDVFYVEELQPYLYLYDLPDHLDVCHLPLLIATVVVEKVAPVSQYEHHRYVEECS